MQVFSAYSDGECLPSAAASFSTVARILSRLGPWSAKQGSREATFFSQPSWHGKSIKRDGMVTAPVRAAVREADVRDEQPMPTPLEWLDASLSQLVALVG